MLTNVRKSDYSNLRVDRVMSAQAMEFFQTDDRFLAVKDVPLLKVDEPAGILSVLDTDDLNRDEVQVRGRESEAEKAGFKYKDVTFKTDERSLEYDLNAAQLAGALKQGRDPSKVIPWALAYKANIHTEVRFASLWAGASWYRTVTGNATDGSDSGTAMNRKLWSDATNDPIAAIRKEADIFLQRTGMLATSIRFGRSLFTAIATNPLVRAQVAVTVGAAATVAMYTSPATIQQLSALLGLKVSVGSAVRNTAGKNLTATNAFIIPAFDALMTFDAPAQVIDTSTPTGFARLAFTGLAPDGFQVRTFERPEIGAGGSMASVLDIYNGFLIVDNKLGTYFSAMAS